MALHPKGGLILAKDLRITVLLDFYGDMLTDKQREVVEEYYNDDLSLAEIAEQKHITRQGVRDAIKRSEVQLIDMETRLGLVKRFKEVKDSLADICDCALRIKELNDGQNAEIDSCAEEILSASAKLVEDQN
jgi:predicted DNA-binding protein YlxM (UPF0122 family)